MNPVDWWHELEGGPIAEARPPPPNADAPYPNLASVPARPTADAASLRGQISTRLLSDRASAAYAAAQLPLTAPPAAPATPPPAATAPSQQTEPLGAKLQAASAPPPSAPPPVASTPPPPAAAPAAAPMPPIPSGPPPPPEIPGMPISARTAPSLPPVPPPARPPPVAPVSTAAVSVPFAGDSATLSTAAQAALRQLAQRHGTAPIAVTGYGEAASSDASDQAAALPLAWARAQAIAGALQSDGVPSAMLRLTGEAIGRGGVAAIAE